MRKRASFRWVLCGISLLYILQLPVALHAQTDFAISGAANSGSLLGNASISPDSKYGSSALRLPPGEGSGQNYMKINGPLTDLDMFGPYTLMIWVKSLGVFDELYGEGLIMLGNFGCKGEVEPGKDRLNGYLLSISTQDDSVFFAGSTDDDVSHNVFINNIVNQEDGTAILADGKWHHLAVRVDEDSTDIFLDGEPFFSQSRTNIPSQPSRALSNGCWGNDVPRIGGGEARGGGDYDDLLVDEVRIYGRALTDQEVLAAMLNAADLPDRLYYTFDSDTVPTDNVPDNVITLVPVQAPVRPPEQQLGVYSVDEAPDLDGACRFRGDGSLDVTVRVPGVINANHVNELGFATGIQQLVRDRVLGKFARLRFAAFDVDSSADIEGVQPEQLLITINNQSIVVPGGVQGQNGAWTEHMVEFPISQLKFNHTGNPALDTTITFSLDVGNIGEDEYWCTTIDWVSIEIDVAAPYVLFHGINADLTTWDEESSPGVLAKLDQYGVRYTRFSAGSNQRSIDNAKLLTPLIADFLSEMGTQKVHFIAHSKGGLDAQYIAALGPPFEILTLSTLSSPHLGSSTGDTSVINAEAADILEEFGADPNGYVDDFLSVPNMPSWVPVPHLPGIRDLTTWAAKDALENKLRGTVKRTYTIGANADLNLDNSLQLGESEGTFPAPLHWAAKQAWRVMRDFSQVRIVSQVTIPAIPRDTHALAYESIQSATPQKNDIVVTDNSARPPYGETLVSLDAANHGTVKNAKNIELILLKTIPVR